MFLFSILAILFSACSGEVTQRSASKAKKAAPVLPVEEIDAPSGDATAGSGEEDAPEEDLEEAELPESVKSDKAIYAFKIEQTGVCMFSFEGKTKAEGCNLLIDKEADSCLIEYRKEIYDISCIDGGVSFDEGLNAVLN